MIRNLAVPRHFVAYLVFISSIRVDPGPRNRGPTSLLALKIRTPVANTGKLRCIGQVPVIGTMIFVKRKSHMHLGERKEPTHELQNILLHLFFWFFCMFFSVLCTI